MRPLHTILAALLISTAPLAMAQSEPTGTTPDPAAVAQAKTDLLTKELALDQEQALKVHALLLKNEQEVSTMRGHCEMMDAKAVKKDDATYASISDVLTPKQNRSLKKLRDSGSLDACHGKDSKGCCSGKKTAAATPAEDVN